MVDEGNGPGAKMPDRDIETLLTRVAATVCEIEQAKRERSAEDARAARTHMAALHGVAQLRKHAERVGSAA
jgi:hypothetical protein